MMRASRRPASFSKRVLFSSESRDRASSSDKSHNSERPSNRASCTQLVARLLCGGPPAILSKAVPWEIGEVCPTAFREGNQVLHQRRCPARPPVLAVDCSVLKWVLQPWSRRLRDLVPLWQEQNRGSAGPHLTLGWVCPHSSFSSCNCLGQSL